MSEIQDVINIFVKPWNHSISALCNKAEDHPRRINLLARNKASESEYLAWPGPSLSVSHSQQSMLKGDVGVWASIERRIVRFFSDFCGNVHFTMVK